MGWGKVIFDAVTAGVFDASEANKCEDRYLDGRDDGYKDGYDDGRKTEQAIQADIDRANEELMHNLENSSQDN